MRHRLKPEFEKCRVRTGTMASITGDGLNGAFVFYRKWSMSINYKLSVIASDGKWWPFPDPAFEHVSASRVDQCPTWEDMKFIRDIFWRPEETIIQIHPPHSKYVNHHPYCLHLWRPVGVGIPLPPKGVIV